MEYDPDPVLIHFFFVFFKNGMGLHAYASSTFIICGTKFTSSTSSEDDYLINLSAKSIL